jgi:hypothetical protein
MDHQNADSRDNAFHPQHGTTEPDGRSGATRTGDGPRHLRPQAPIAKRPRIDMWPHARPVQFLEQRSGLGRVRVLRTLPRPKALARMAELQRTVEPQPELDAGERA